MHNDTLVLYCSLVYAHDVQAGYRHEDVGEDDEENGEKDKEEENKQGQDDDVSLIFHRSLPAKDVFWKTATVHKSMTHISRSPASHNNTTL